MVVDIAINVENRASNVFIVWNLRKQTSLKMKTVIPLSGLVCETDIFLYDTTNLRLCSRL